MPANPAPTLSQIFIKVDGALVPTELMNALAEVVVDTSLQLPSMFTIRVADSELKWVDGALLSLGKKVEISAQPAGGQEGVLIKGEITALEPSFSAEGKTVLLVRGYDKAHRLHRGKKTRTFLSQTDSDIVQKIAGEAGLSTDMDATSIRYDFVMQNNQTNMEFLSARAERLGYQIYSAEGKLYFKKGQATLGAGPELTLAENLTSFQPTITSAHQSDKMKVMGWDSKAKQAIVGQVTPNSALNQGGLGKTGGAASQVFGAAEDIVTDQPVFTVDEAIALATGLSDDISREFVQAEGICAGDPKVKAGYSVTIKGVGTKFSGKYFITSATHIYTAQGYETHFSISGRQPNTLSQLLVANNDQGHGLVQGVVVGLVTNLNDPDNLGRVKVKYPWLGDNIESDWVRVATPSAGKERGIYYLPEVDDEVLIAFEHGDVHHPYLIGALWNSKDKPPEPNSKAASGGKNNHRIIKSRSGHLIILDDTDGSEQIIIRDKTNNNELVIDSSKKSMTIKVDGDFTVEAKGKVSIKSTQDMMLEATGKGSFKGTGGLNLESPAQAALKGTGGLNLESNGQTAVKGIQVSVSGSAMTEVKGAIVKIN